LTLLTHRFTITVIRSFADKRTAAIFYGEFVRGLDGQIQQRAREKLIYLHSAADLRDLAVPPSNHLKALAGDLQGLYSIRVNKQWRICFRWEKGDAFEVLIIDYH
jgi:proteic killer suppression protein